MTVRVERVAAELTFPLRQRILRPQETVEQMALPGDEAESTAHFAALDDGEIVGTASVRCEAPPWTTGGLAAWRLRGMATAEDRRNQGIGTVVLAAAFDHVRRNGGGLFWCNARLPAVAFYRRAGFTTRGEAWEEPVIGPHIAMECLVTDAGARSSPATPR
ncbi:MAG TPA: GNAT family N-acetyltransferase [Acidimicrobiales bacterium]